MHRFRGTGESTGKNSIPAFKEKDGETSMSRVGRNSIIIYNSIFIPTVYTVGIWQNQMNLAQNIRSSFLYGR